MVTFDVTGTLIKFKGSLACHYCAAFARETGRLAGDGDKIAASFKAAYAQQAAAVPCFGGVPHGERVQNSKDWWRSVVKRSFQDLPDAPPPDVEERIFKRIYSQFGSHSTYAAFEDALPFLRFLRRRGVVTGVVSNGDERYEEHILPMLGLSEELDHLTLSTDVGYEKPSTEIFESALQKAGVPAAETLHIGDRLELDFEPAVKLGMKAVLIDRFEKSEARQWRHDGLPVARDLLDVVQILTKMNALPPST